MGKIPRNETLNRKAVNLVVLPHFPSLKFCKSFTSLLNYSYRQIVSWRSLKPGQQATNGQIRLFGARVASQPFRDHPVERCKRTTLEETMTSPLQADRCDAEISQRVVRCWSRWLVCALLFFPSLVGAAERTKEGEKASPPAATTAKFDSLSEQTANPLPGSEELLRNLQQRSIELSKTLIAATISIQVGSSQGSGVIVSEDGYVLTAAHVVATSFQRPKVILTDGRETQCRVLGVDRELDIAVLKITEEGPWPSVSLAEPEEFERVKAGAWCLATGHPGGYEKTRPPVLRLGRIVRIEKNVLQSDGPLLGGDSGGPLFDFEGHVIGIHSRIGPRFDWNFHVPVATIRDNWDQLVKADRLEAQTKDFGAILGVRGTDDVQGCRVTELIVGFPASQAGVRLDDLVLQVDEKKVGTFRELRELIKGKKPGQEIELSLLREGEPLKLKVVLGDRNDLK